MNTKKLSINKACAIIGTVIAVASASLLAILYLLTENYIVVLCGLVFVLLVLFCGILLVSVMRRNLTLFSETLCRTLDDMMAGDTESPLMDTEEENLFYKMIL